MIYVVSSCSFRHLWLFVCLYIYIYVHMLTYLVTTERYVYIYIYMCIYIHREGCKLVFTDLQLSSGPIGRCCSVLEVKSMGSRGI